MTDHTPLSPAAQAVLDAIKAVSPAPADEIAAVALRAAADQVDWNLEPCSQFCTIADELDGPGREPVSIVGDLNDEELEAGFRAWYHQRYGFPYCGAVPLVGLIAWTRDFATHYGCHPAALAAELEGGTSTSSTH